MRCAVVGAGAWGTALASLLAENEHEVTLWAYEPDVAESVNTDHENRRFLDGVPLHPMLRATSVIENACTEAELVLFAPPSHVLRQVAGQAARWIPDGATLVVATKGIERERLALMTDVVAQEVRGRPIVALSGPSFALEVAHHLPTAIVAASTDADAALRTQKAFSTSAFRVYTQRDVVGVELGGALKNVIAVGCGAADGLGFGDSARASLMTRGLAEITRLGVAMGANPLTFLGLAGVGDLILTCTGDLSRNRQLGKRLAKGEKPEEIVASQKAVAEGYVTAKPVYQLSRKLGVDMPITEAVYRVCYEGVHLLMAAMGLMNRESKDELAGIFFAAPGV